MRLSERFLCWEVPIALYKGKIKKRDVILDEIRLARQKGGPPLGCMEPRLVTGVVEKNEVGDRV